MATWFRIILAFAFMATILPSRMVVAQEKNVEMSELLHKATSYLLRQSVDLLSQGYFFVEMSKDDSRATKKGERCYQIWLAKSDRAISYYSGLAISSSGRIWEISPPATMMRTVYSDPKPKVALKEALSLAAEFVANNGALEKRNGFHTAYLISRPDGVQYWHVLGKKVSLFVFMDGRVQETGDI
jgi:hypothetical protein